MLYGAVVGIVDFMMLQILEELEQVTCAADAEPDGGHSAQDGGDAQVAPEEVGAPPLRRPPVEEVPDDDRHEAEAELVDEGEREYAPCQNLVSEGVGAGDADDLGDDEVAEAESLLFLALLRGGGLVVAVDAAVEHLVHVEGGASAAEGDDDVEEDAGHLGEEGEFAGVDGELVRIHRPDDIRVEGA